MPVRVIGMIGVTLPSGEATVHVIKGGISTAYASALRLVAIGSTSVQPPLAAPRRSRAHPEL